MPTPWIYALLGGALIGISALLLLLLLGRIAGVSGITYAALTERGAERAWRACFLLGLLAGGGLLRALTPEVFAAPAAPGPYLLVAAGVIVGFGVILGTGCTSGHGVCGVSRLSPRSLVATVSFLLVGMLTASLWHGVNL